MNIRLIGTSDEVTTLAARIAHVIDIDECSRTYPSRKNSDHVLVYLTPRL